MAALLPTAFSIFLVVLAQSAATSRAYAAKYQESFDENVDLVGLAFASASAGLSGTFVVNGSPTKTQMVDGAGGRSQVSQLTTGVIVLIVLLFLTKPLSYMPDAVLASIVFLIGIELVDIVGLRTILRWRVDEFVVAALTAVVVVVFGVEQGILLAIVLSLLDHVRRSYHPHDSFLVRSEAGRWTTLTVPEEGSETATNADALPGLVDLPVRGESVLRERQPVHDGDPSCAGSCGGPAVLVLHRGGRHRGRGLLRRADTARPCRRDAAGGHAARLRRDDR